MEFEKASKEMMLGDGLKKHGGFVEKLLTMAEVVRGLLKQFRGPWRMFEGSQRGLFAKGYIGLLIHIMPGGIIDVTKNLICIL